MWVHTYSRRLETYKQREVYNTIIILWAKAGGGGRWKRRKTVRHWCEAASVHDIIIII